MDYREQIVLQSAQNAHPFGVSITTYRFRHVAERLAERGLLRRIQQTSYTITPAGSGMLRTHGIPVQSPDQPAFDTRMAAE